MDRRGLRKLAEAPVDTCVDFDAEMSRILDAFRISELLKRNTKTRGLHGKDLKTFLTLVGGLKQAIVEDIIQVQKDAAEVRMRRAGYLRYTNKTAYGIVEERYAEKDWKTGRKCVSSASNSSGITTPMEETAPATRYVLLQLYAQERLTSSSEEQENELPHKFTDLHDSDRRHLESTHKRVNGEDGLHEYSIEPYRTPLLPLLPDPAPGKKSAATRILSIKATQHKPVPVQAEDNCKKDCLRSAPDGWQTVTHGAIPRNTVARPRVWGNIPSQRRADGSQPTPNIVPSRYPEFPTLLSDTWRTSNDASTKAREVQPPSAWTAQEPEGFVLEPNDTFHYRPSISQKKKAKKNREAKRKAKKLATPEDTTDLASLQAEAEEANNDADAVSTAVSIPVEAQMDPGDIIYDEHIASHIDNEIGQAGLVAAQVTEPPEKTILMPTTATIPTTKHQKHMHWLRFVRYFVVDQFNSPIPPSCSGCSHTTSCMFENSEIPDCPYHEPFCDCADPMRDQCYLVLPCQELYSTGPYNRIRGEKLMALYETNDRTKGRLMLVDDDMLDYLLEVSADGFFNRDPGIMPTRLAKEYLDSNDRRIPTPLIEQECRFQQLWARNVIIKEKLTQDTLRDIQRNTVECAGTQYMCYCRDDIAEQMSLGKDIIACSFRHCSIRYFHESCVKDLGVEKVSRWYCADCAHRMRVVARHTLDKIDCGMEVKKMAKGVVIKTSREIYDKELDELL